MKQFVMSPALILLLASTVGAQELDSYGCYQDRYTGRYECLRGQYRNDRFYNQSDMLRKMRERDTRYNQSGEHATRLAPVPGRAPDLEVLPPWHIPRYSSRRPPTNPRKEPGEILDALDCKTFSARVKDRELRLRLYGVDCPTSGRGNAALALDFVRGLLQEKNLDLEMTGTDKADGETAIVYLKDDTTLEERLVLNGLARVDESCARLECRAWKSMENRAKARKVGLWRQTSPQRQTVDKK
jgi:endonuclease YncB( thermonuclease family)